MVVSPSWDQQRRVSIAQEAEVMSQGVVVNGFPVSMEESAYQQQQRALRLMEIGDQRIDNLVGIAWGDDDLGAAMQSLQPMPVQERDDILDGAPWRDAI